MPEGPVPPQPVVVVLSGLTAKVSDGWSWAEATLPEPVQPSLTLPYSSLRAFANHLDEDEDLYIRNRGACCLITMRSLTWEVNVPNLSLIRPPEFKPNKTFVVTGYQLLEAYRSLKHLMHRDLSERGLLWCWANECKELVVGDGGRFAGHPIGVSGLELPVKILIQLGHILSVRQSEKVLLRIGTIFVHAQMTDVSLQATLPDWPRFNPVWYSRLKSKLTEDVQVIKLSRDKLRRGIKMVEATKGDSLIQLFTFKDYLALKSQNACGKSGALIKANGALKEPIFLDMDKLNMAVEALSQEMITLKVCKSLVEVSDDTHWEIILLKYCKIGEE